MPDYYSQKKIVVFLSSNLKNFKNVIQSVFIQPGMIFTTSSVKAHLTDFSWFRCLDFNLHQETSPHNSCRDKRTLGF